MISLLTAGFQLGTPYTIATGIHGTGINWYVNIQDINMHIAPQLSPLSLFSISLT